VPLPSPVPDLGSTRSNVTTCDDITGNLTLAARTAAQTGSNLDCSDAGCLFGAPLPIPNATNTSTSTCVINTIAEPASGNGNCATGATSLSLPLDSEVFLTGDSVPWVAGIQPCPICSKKCVGGDNDTQPCTGDGDCPGGTCSGSAECFGGVSTGGACTPQTSVVSTCAGGVSPGKPCTSDVDCPFSICTQVFPTTHDCMPAPGTSVGSIRIPFSLTAGTASDTSDASGTFCGYCWDFDVSNGDGGAGTCSLDPSHTCLNTLQCSNLGKGKCQGPVFRARRMRTARRSRTRARPAARRTLGLPEGGGEDHRGDGFAGRKPDRRRLHAAHLISVFCIPPTFDATVDNGGHPRAGRRPSTA
jgi:hypothetical protein